MAQDRTALLVRCSRAEAEQIRRAARAERRTISGYILNAVMNRIKMRENLAVPPGKRRVGEE